MPFQQQHFVKALYESFPEPVLAVGMDKILLSYNKAAAEQFGYASDEIAGKPARMLYASDEDYAACLQVRALTGAVGDSTSSVYRYCRKDGSTFSARLKTMRILDERGEPQGLVAIVHDISDYLALDRDRLAAWGILDTALQAIPEGFAIFDPNEKLIAFNEGYRRVCGPAGPVLRIGITAEEIIRLAKDGNHYPDAPPGTAEAERWIADRMHDFRHPSGEPKIFRYGDDRWLQVENTKTKDGNTAVLRIDVTGLKQAQAALERQRLDYYTLVQNIPDFLTRISPQKTYTFANNNFARFVGVPAEDLVGRHMMDFIPPKEWPRVEERLDSLSPLRPIITAEQKRILPDGRQMWIFWSNMAVFEGDALVEFVTVGRDITKIKQQQARIARQTDELQRKNDALNQFTGTVSHDLKAPLRHISMFSEMILDDVKMEAFEDLPVYANHLRDSARRMDRLIDSLLDYSQIAYQIGNWSLVPLREAVDAVILDLESFIREAGAEIVIGDLPEINGDAELLKRLLQNLIGNAVKYRRPVVPPVVRIFSTDDDDTVNLIVEDNGIGIDPRFSWKIFDVFQRLHRDETVYPGTGIGLALAKRIVESHNGSIELDTGFVEGARFIVTFPKAPGAGREGSWAAD